MLLYGLIFELFKKMPIDNQQTIIIHFVLSLVQSIPSITAFSLLHPSPVSHQPPLKSI